MEPIRSTEQINQHHLTQEQIKTEQANFITRVYGWMSLALVITGLTAFYVASTPKLIELIFSNSLVFYGLIIIELLSVGYLALAIQKMSAARATTVFIAYSILNGLTFAMIFLIFTAGSIASTFFITAGTFGAMSLYGYYTKQDLTSFGNLAIMALIGLIIASVVNLFWNNQILYWITTYAGVLIFVTLTAYDTQKIKQMNTIGTEGTETGKKMAIMGALTLYLDFINLFLFLLRIFGRRR